MKQAQFLYVDTPDTCAWMFDTVWFGLFQDTATMVKSYVSEIERLREEVKDLLERQAADEDQYKAMTAENELCGNYDVNHPTVVIASVVTGWLQSWTD